MAPDLLLSYMAGFVDADGSISIVTVAKKKRYIPKVAATNCNYEIIELFKNNFGGKIRKRVRKNKNWRDCYEWSLTCRKAGKVIEQLFPYLIIKKEQAALALQAIEIKSKSNAGLFRWRHEEWKKIQTELQILKEKCKNLNKRGT